MKIEKVDTGFSQIVADIEPLESLEAPGWVDFWAGVGAGATVVGGGFVIGVAIT